MSAAISASRTVLTGVVGAGFRTDVQPAASAGPSFQIAELDGPERAVATLDDLADPLADYHAYHGTRADLLRRLGRTEESRDAYDKAIELAANTAEIAYLTRRRDQFG